MTGRGSSPRTEWTPPIFDAKTFVETEIDFHWWHREVWIMRNAFINGSARVRARPDLVPKSSQLPIYKSYYAAGVLPDDFVFAQ